MAVAASSRKAHDIVRRRLFAAREFWRNDNNRYGRLTAECLLLQHYVQDVALTKYRTRIKPKTLKQFNLARHKASLLLRQDPDFDTHAVHPGADQAAAEVTSRILKNTFNDPLKGYHDTRSRMVWSMLAAERGMTAIEWDQKWGICFRPMDPRRGHITPGFVYLHDPRNPCFLEELPMRRSDIMRMKSAGWNIPDDLNYDGGIGDFPLEGGERDADGITRDQAGRDFVDPNNQYDPIVTVCKAWFRDDPFGRDNKKFGDSLPENQWYHVDDRTQEKQPFDPMNPAPPTSQAGNPMRLVTSKAEEVSHEPPDGYLIITAPFYPGEKPLFEGSWTEGAVNKDAHLAAFPYMELTSYKHPLRHSGISDTELTHSIMIMDNAVTRHGYEQTNQTTNLLITQPGKLKDSQGNQFQFRNVPNDIAYADDLLTSEAARWLQSPGINPAVIQMSSLIDQKWQDIGTGDFSASLGPERSKDIPVGTANQLQQTGDLPVQLHKQDLNLQEAIGGRVVVDLCRAYMGDQVVSWVTDQGEAAYATVRGEDLVPVHVTVLASEDWRQADTDRTQAQAQLIGMLGKSGLPMPVQIALMKDAGIGAEALAAMNQAAQQQAQAPQKPDPATVTAQASMIAAVGKAGLPLTTLGPLLSDAGVDPRLVAAVMQVISGQQATPANGPPSPGGNPNLQLVQGGNPNG